MPEAVSVPEKPAKPEKPEADGELFLTIAVIVNDRPVVLSGKKSYVFVDIFEYIDFDLSKSQGGGIVTNLNGRPAQYMENLHNGDRIEIYWRK